MINFKPVIKWSGSKRPIAQEIVNHFPREINTYYEPFCGGASVMRCLLDNIENNNIRVNKIICSDLNNDLINLWNKIKETPTLVSEYYKKLWNELNSTEDKAIKRSYFEKVRHRLNNEHNPLDFLFILRTTTNGMCRYNKNGEFNNSFHITRNGIKPETLKRIIFEWSELINKYDVEFRCCSFENIVPNGNDLIFCDPPYANTKGMYYGGFNNELLFEWLRKLPCKWLMTYDGRSGDIDNTYDVPEDLYKQHLYLRSGNSSFKRTIGKSNDSIVYESLYKNY